MITVPTFNSLDDLPELPADATPEDKFILVINGDRTLSLLRVILNNATADVPAPAFATGGAGQLSVSGDGQGSSMVDLTGAGSSGQAGVITADGEDGLATNQPSGTGGVGGVGVLVADGENGVIPLSQGGTGGAGDLEVVGIQNAQVVDAEGVGVAGGAGYLGVEVLGDGVASVGGEGSEGGAGGLSIDAQSNVVVDDLMGEGGEFGSGSVDVLDISATVNMSGQGASGGVGGAVANTDGSAIPTGQGSGSGVGQLDATSQEFVTVNDMPGAGASGQGGILSAAITEVNGTVDDMGGAGGAGGAGSLSAAAAPAPDSFEAGLDGWVLFPGGGDIRAGEAERVVLSDYGVTPMDGAGTHGIRLTGGFGSEEGDIPSGARKVVTETGTASVWVYLKTGTYAQLVNETTMVSINGEEVGQWTNLTIPCSSGDSIVVAANDSANNDEIFVDMAVIP